jgi:hypothetical protein
VCPRFGLDVDDEPTGGEFPGLGERAVHGHRCLARPAIAEIRPLRTQRLHIDELAPVAQQLAHVTLESHVCGDLVLGPLAHRHKVRVPLRPREVPPPGSSPQPTWQREALELKVRAEGDGDPLAEGLAQLDAYLDRLSLDTGVLVVFDRRPNAAPVAERTTFDQATSPSGRAVTVLRA